MSSNKPERAYFDYETRSTIDLRKCGLHRYAMDPTTEVMCAAYRLPYWPQGKTGLWTPEYPQLGIMQQGGNFDELFEFFEWAANGGLVESHNAAFERAIWRHISAERYSWPEVPLTQWRCSAAQAAAVALPRGLDDALAAMRLAMRKDEDGSKVMKKMTKPRKPRKAERDAWQAAHGNMPMGILYHENRHLLEQLYEYVRQDVLAEEALSYVLPDLSPDELQVYHVDQAINDRGFCVDMDGVRSALVLRKGEAAMLNAELAVVTSGAVERASLRDKLAEWLASEGLDVENMQAATLDAYLDNWPEGASDLAKQAVEINRKLGRSASTSKYEAMAKYASPVDDRVRGGLLYHGAGTGRWAGAGVQPQNFTKGSLKARDGEDPDAFVNRLWADIKTEDADYLRETYDASVTDVLSHGLRSAIVPSPGRELFVADYAGIEARVLVWLAGDDETCQKFVDGVDLYVDMACDIYHRKITKADKQERQLGKATILGAGFGMGGPKFVSAAAMYGVEITETFAREVIAAYRAKYWRIVQLWNEIEATAIQAVQTKREVECGRLCWYQHGVFLYMELPCGRRISYPFPTVSMAETPWGKDKLTLQFKGVNPKNRQWQTQRTYGGSLCLAEDTEVLTRRRGWVKIQHIEPNDLLWDGFDWTHHGGLLDNGLRSVISVDGIQMTTDHRVLTEEGWQDASSCGRYHRADVWLPDGYELCREQWQKVPVECAVPVRDAESNGGVRVAQGSNPVVRVPMAGTAVESTHPAWIIAAPYSRGVEFNAPTMQQQKTPRLPQLRRARDFGLSAMARISALCRRHASDMAAWSDHRPHRQQRQLRADELSLGDSQGAVQQQAGVRTNQWFDRSRVCSQPRHIEVTSLLPDAKRVFDITNVGTRNQFVVRNGARTRCLIVHNCENATQATAASILRGAMLRLEQDSPYDIVLTVHDEVIAEADEGVGNLHAFERIMAEAPEWADGLPVAAESFRAHRYRK